MEDLNNHLLFSDEVIERAVKAEGDVKLDKVHDKVLVAAATKNKSALGRGKGKPNPGGEGGGFTLRESRNRAAKNFSDNFRDNLQERGDKKFEARPPRGRGGRGRGRGRGGQRQ